MWAPPDGSLSARPAAHPTAGPAGEVSKLGGARHVRGPGAAPTPAPGGATAVAGRASRWWALGWLAPLALQLVHTLAVWPTYHVGSFDDDGNYLMAAHVLADGGWLATHMPSGATVVANYLPGYPLMLVPVVWLFGGALWAPRALSTLCVALLYPLLWSWMGRRGVRPWWRVAVLGFLALNEVLATYSTMVMAEAPFLLVLVLALYALDAWQERPRSAWAVAAVVLLAYLVWLKEAGIGLVAGAVLYELWRRRWPRAVLLGAGVGLLLLPGLVARWATGNAPVGDRYAGEISNPGEGGLLHQVPREVWQDSWAYLQSVLRQSVLPSGSPLPHTGPVHTIVAVIGVTVPVFSVLGAVVWYRRHPRAEVWMVAAYFAETLAYPYTNQRRVILVLPLVTLWYVVGACVAGRTLLALRGRAVSRAVLAGGVVCAVLAASVPSAFGFTTNYLYRAGQQSSEFAHSSGMALLRAIGAPSAVVETDYRGTVAYFTGHRTAWTAFTRTTPYGPFAAVHSHHCTLPVAKGALAADHPSFLVVGDFNIPGLMDSPCLLSMASSPSTAPAIGAARLLSSDHDDTSVFELLGPGTSQPLLVDRTQGRAPQGSKPLALPHYGRGDAGGTGYTSAAAHGEAEFVWTWSRPEPLDQVSVGAVLAPGGQGGASPITGASLAIERPGGRWQELASSPGPVGDGGSAPYL
ncbi:MAG TPA: phospholipid carrier-dependent glycosyltransferase, partial [Acidimicrobiales bacterium]|nr:phospholipid carrier-dependent glycosyltransferase [Acidimicrobiales bacterium]